MRKVAIFLTSAILAVVLVFHVSASEELSTTAIGFYQTSVESDGPYYKRVGNSSKTVESKDYHMGEQCWYLSYGQFPADNFPLDRDYVQITLYIAWGAANTVPSEYRDDMFPSLQWFDYNSYTGHGYSQYLFPMGYAKELKPVKSSQESSSSGSTLNIVLTKQQLIDMSVYNAGRNNYRFYIMPQINSNYMIYYLQQTTGIGMVIVNTVRWSDTSDIVPIDEQTLQALAKIQSQLDETNQKLDEANDKLASIDQSIKDQDQNSWEFGSNKVDGMFGDVSLGIDASSIEDNPVASLSDTILSLFDDSETSTIVFPSLSIFDHNLSDRYEIDLASFENHPQYGGYFSLVHNLLKLSAWVAFAVYTFSCLNDVIGVISGEKTWSELWSKSASEQTSLFHMDDDPPTSLFHMDDNSPGHIKFYGEHDRGWD